jgi:hypothetical protein
MKRPSAPLLSSDKSNHERAAAWIVPAQNDIGSNVLAKSHVFDGRAKLNSSDIPPPAATATAPGDAVERPAAVYAQPGKLLHEMRGAIWRRSEGFRSVFTMAASMVARCASLSLLAPRSGPPSAGIILRLVAEHEEPRLRTLISVAGYPIKVKSHRPVSVVRI